MKKRDKYHLLEEKSINEITFQELTEYLFRLIIKRYGLNKEDIIKKGHCDQIDFRVNDEKITVRLVKSMFLNRLEFYLNLKEKSNPNIIISVGYTLENGKLLPIDAINAFILEKEPCFPMLMIAGKTYIDSETKPPYINKKNIDLPTSPLLAELIISILPSFEWIEKKFSCREIIKAH